VGVEVNAAIILPDNSIAAVIMADASVDRTPGGYPAGTMFINAPDDCDGKWIYDPATGFQPPPPPLPKEVEF